MTNHFANNEAEKLLSKLGIELCTAGQRSKSVYLILFSTRVRCWQSVFRLKNAHALCTSKSLGEHMDYSRVNIVDARTQLQQLSWGRMIFIH